MQHGRKARKAAVTGISEGCCGISHPEQEAQEGFQRFFIIEETPRRFFPVIRPQGDGWGRLRTTSVCALRRCRSRVAGGRNGTKRHKIYIILYKNEKNNKLMVAFFGKGAIL